MAQTAHFGPQLFRFLRQLAENNQRQWFKAEKARYESDVRDPLLGFISDFGPRLRDISPAFRADPRPVGGSLFRIYRDTRFAKDKSPYKTPRGFDAEHPLIDDLKRKDFIAVCRFDEAAATSPDFLEQYTAFCRTAAPYIELLTRALELEW